ncbi:MAG: hypothetical protein HY231_13765 [Acidobacteria bacterium]|nr:hypothetical protein [Acidobacteriota bacterium]
MANNEIEKELLEIKQWLIAQPLDQRQLEFPLTTIRIPVFKDECDSPSISFSGGLDGHRQTIQEAYDIYSRRGCALGCRCQNWHG